MQQEKKLYQITRLCNDDPQQLEYLRHLRDGLMAYHNTYTSSDVFMDFVKRRLNDETMLIAFIGVDGIPVGYGHAFDVVEHPYMPEWTRAGYIAQFYIEEEHRRHKMGEMLLNYIHDWFDKRGIKKMMLNVGIENEIGQRFWKKHNYTPLAIRMKREI